MHELFPSFYFWILLLHYFDTVRVKNIHKLIKAVLIKIQQTILNLFVKSIIYQEKLVSLILFWLHENIQFFIIPAKLISEPLEV